MKKYQIILSCILAIGILFIACSNDDDYTGTDPNNEGTITDPDIEFTDLDFTPTDWTAETHSKEADPNFTEVYSDTEVKRIDLVISESNWEYMLDNITDLYGTFGGSNSGGPGGGGTFADENPTFVPSSVYYNGKEWYKVGLRFKGNSSLSSSWSSGILKLSFKLDFDEFEDEYPQIKNQRFFGFKQFSLKNNYNDASQLREKVAADIFRASGLAISNTSFYTVYVDYGDGPKYFGLYTMVEEVDDTVIETQFSSDEGNLYKPEDYGSSFAYGTFNTDGFEKKTNEDEADWSDIQNLFSVLHSDLRTTDPAAWRTNLEAIFDTDTFLNYLAVNTVIQNWDTYGRMEHNYFLYNNPENNKLTWIPWDNNEALQDGNREGALNLNFSNLSYNDWPLISYLYEDDVYKAKYDTYVQAVSEGAFDASSIQAIYDNYASLIEPYATSELPGFTFLYNSSSFYYGVSTLKSHATSRATAVSNYLN